MERVWICRTLNIIMKSPCTEAGRIWWPEGPYRVPRPALQFSRKALRTWRSPALLWSDVDIGHFQGLKISHKTLQPALLTLLPTTFELLKHRGKFSTLGYHFIVPNISISNILNYRKILARKSTSGRTGWQKIQAPCVYKCSPRSCKF